ncbi:hypothetical protein [Modicisalibacter luteus]|uniref:Uncharacterized protein n=1 Tax=Modicisalibacter luteus TaxID=453962 RepID=A0ABV7LY30_9GAMM|nr:hypothetical protein [Halomonas lutea]GHB01067.1 hypothetical protein GCM10007159_23530 [Halomonas lutea]
MAISWLYRPVHQRLQALVAYLLSNFLTRSLHVIGEGNAMSRVIRFHRIGGALVL